MRPISPNMQAFAQNTNYIYIHNTKTKKKYIGIKIYIYLPDRGDCENEGETGVVPKTFCKRCAADSMITKENTNYIKKTGIL